MAHRLYFAYGSNLDFDQMAARCPGAEYLGAATLDGHALRMDGAGFATVVPAPGSHVQGVLWDLSNVNEEAMDGFEGVEAGCYDKNLVSVRYVGDKRPGCADGFATAWGYGAGEAAGLSLDALIYTSARPPFVNHTHRADYLNKVRRGAAACGLDATTQNQLSAIQLVA